jgi:hypothetical protein
MFEQFARLMFLIGVLGLLVRPGRARGDDQAATTAAPTTQGDSDGSQEVPDESTRLAMPLFGFSVIPPSYWNRVPEDRPAEAAMWELHDLGNGQVIGVISIQAKTTQAKDSLALVRANHLESEARREDLDGTPAYEVPVPAHPRFGNTHSVRAIECVHEGMMYLIETAESGQMVVTPKLRQLAKTWKWVPFESLSQHLDFRDAPRALGKYLQIAVPNVLKPPPPELLSHGVTTQFAYDVHNARLEFALDYSTEALQSGEDFATACKRIGEELSYSHAANPPVTFVPRGGTPARQASNWVAGTLPSSKAQVVVRWVLVDLSGFGDQSVAEARFALAPGMPDTVQTAYEKTIDKMIDSIAPKQEGAQELPQPPAQPPAGAAPASP